MLPLLEASQRAGRPGPVTQLPLFASEATQQALFHAHGGSFTEPFVFIMAPGRARRTAPSPLYAQQLLLFVPTATQLLLESGE
jgi:hypothetical protein